MKIAIIVVGIAALLLGGLWLLQGLALVSIPPLLCVAECEAIEGFSPGWAVAGFVLAAGGVAALVYALSRP